MARQRRSAKRDNAGSFFSAALLWLCGFSRLVESIRSSASGGRSAGVRCAGTFADFQTQRTSPLSLDWQRHSVRPPAGSENAGSAAMTMRIEADRVCGITPQLLHDAHASAGRICGLVGKEWFRQVTLFKASLGLCVHPGSHPHQWFDGLRGSAGAGVAYVPQSEASITTSCVGLGRGDDGSLRGDESAAHSWPC